MDDFILMVLGAFGVRDFPILIQVPHCTISKHMVEGLAHMGLDTVLPKGTLYRITEPLRGTSAALLGKMKGAEGASARRAQQGRRHFLIEVSSMPLTDGRTVNEFCINVQFPDSPQAPAGVAAMVTHGLRFWLGKYCKNITVVGREETLPGAWEAIGADMRTN